MEYGESELLTARMASTTETLPSGVNLKGTLSRLAIKACSMNIPPFPIQAR